jgi:hypothetical protein
MAGLKRITDLPLAGTIDGDELLEISQLSSTVTITATTISAAASDNSFNDSGSGFVTAGFAVGDRVRVSGFTGSLANNILAATITALTAAKMTIGGVDGDVIVDDAAGESVSITKWTSRRLSIADLEAAIGGGGGSSELVVSTQTADYTPDLDDAGAYVRMTSIGEIDFNVPTNASVAFAIGTVIQLRQGGVGQLVVVPAGGVTVNTAETLKARKLGSTLALVKVATNEWDLTGDLELLP